MNIEIHIAPTSAQTWVAATASSPYFCVEADSEESALALARHAVHFYGNNIEAAIRVKSRKERPDITPIPEEAHRELVAV